MYEVYYWDEHAGQFQVQGAYGPHGAAVVVAGRLTRATGLPHLVRFRADGPPSPG